MLRSLLGIDYRPHVRQHVTLERFGSDYGGWHLATDYVAGDSIVYSAGVGEDISFDLQIIERFGLQVHAFDPTPRSIQWARSQHLPAAFTLHEYGIADFDGELTLYPPSNPAHISHSVVRKDAGQTPIQVPVKKLSTILRTLGHTRLDVLKLDIEGAEYAAVADMIAAGIRPMQLLVEFHHRFPGIGLRKTKDTVKLLTGSGYTLVWVSDSAEEFGFLLTDAAKVRAVPCLE
jgi:FkbM family methyltransferase